MLTRGELLSTSRCGLVIDTSIRESRCDVSRSHRLGCGCVPWRQGLRILGAMRAIFGGTFDPPHFAHLAAGETAHDQLNVDMVTFIPTGRPWQKAGRDVSEAHHRLSMTELAIEGIEYFTVDDREVHRDGWTITIDTVESFDEERIVLIVGADAAGGIPTWHRSSELLERVQIAVVPRPGVKRSDVESAVQREIAWLDMPPIDLSGTMLRRHVSEGRSIRFLVPDPVLAYVDDHNLYQKPS